MDWVWTGLVLLMTSPLLAGLGFVALHCWVRYRYVPLIARIFEEKPLFVIPRGQPVAGAEDVEVTARDGLRLRGCYLRTTASHRRGVILFGLEFGSNRWSCVPYCERLLESGYDVFAIELRGQGESDKPAGHDPIQWIDNHEVEDMKSAIAYLKSRPDAEGNGIGFFGISKGGAAGLLAGTYDPWLRCFLTDGAFGTYVTVAPYMRKWFGIYNHRQAVHGLIPKWYYTFVGACAVGRIARRRGCSFPWLERHIGKLSPRPLLMIHGGGDTYIKPEMARELFDCAREPKEFWLVDRAKHNQGLQVAREEYHRRVLEFFDKNLAGQPAPGKPEAPSLAETV